MDDPGGHRQGTAVGDEECEGTRHFRKEFGKPGEYASVVRQFLRAEVLLPVADFQPEAAPLQFFPERYHRVDAVDASLPVPVAGVDRGEVAESPVQKIVRNHLRYPPGIPRHGADVAARRQRMGDDRGAFKVADFLQFIQREAIGQHAVAGPAWRGCRLSTRS